MQMSIDDRKNRSLLFFFGGRSYMMRSEKRGRSGPAFRAPNPPGRAPRKRKRCAGFPYKLLTSLLLILIWPVGMILLWKRKLRWKLMTKLLVSVLTLAACVLLYGFALTVNTDNRDYNRIQDSVNDFLDDAAKRTVELGKDIAKASVDAYDSAYDLGGLLIVRAREPLADALDWTLEFTKPVRVKINEWTAGEDEPKVDVLDITPVPSPSPTPTIEPAKLPTANKNASELMVYKPGAASAPKEGIAVSEGFLSRDGLLKPTSLPEPIRPTPAPRHFVVKPASEFTVYYNPTGKSYHTRSACGKMTTAEAHTLQEVLSEAHEPCNVCQAPDRSLLEEPFIVWVDAEATAHLSDECNAFEGEAKLMRAQAALDEGLQACPDCGAGAYLESIEAGSVVTISDAPTPPPTSEPEVKEEPSEVPSVQATTASTAKPTAKSTATTEPTDKPTPTATLRPTDIPEAVG